MLEMPGAQPDSRRMKRAQTETVREVCSFAPALYLPDR